MVSFVRHFEDFYRETSRDIFKFARALNFEPTWQQEQLLRAVQAASEGRGPHWIACRSGKGPGKTTASSLVGLWWSYRSHMGLCDVTAPSMKQCTDIWMKEARDHLQRAVPVLRKIIKAYRTRIEMFGNPDWGVKCITATREENIQGIHNPNLAVIVEEASGVSTDIINAMKGTLSNPNSLFLLIGNPNTRTCAFFDCFHSQKHKWKCLHWNAEETPESAWFSRQRNRDIEEEFGKDSDVYRVAVLGEFPHTDPRCLISSEDMELVGDRDLLLPCSRLERPTGGIARQFGMDFARFGGDESTLFRRTGNSIVEKKIYAHGEPIRVVEESFWMQEAAGWTDRETWFVADAGGMGQGVMFKFHDHNKKVIEFHNNGTAIEKDYANKITEAWFNLSRLVKTQRCYIPLDPLTVAQLSNRQYFTNKKGQLILESKDEYIRRGYDSPDRADGLVLAFYDEVEAVSRLSVQANERKALGVKR